MSLENGNYPRIRLDSRVSGQETKPVLHSVGTHQDISGNQIHCLDQAPEAVSMLTQKDMDRYTTVMYQILPDTDAKKRVEEIKTRYEEAGPEERSRLCGVIHNTVEGVLGLRRRQLQPVVATNQTIFNRR